MVEHVEISYKSLDTQFRIFFKYTFGKIFKAILLLIQ